MQPTWESDYMHIIDVDLSKMKVIRNYEQLLEFHNEYSTMNAMSGYPHIDWNKVSQKFSGIEIVPYINETRFDEEIQWYYTWDVASGCIWDSSGIKSVKNFGDKKQDYKVLYGLPERNDLKTLGLVELTYSYDSAEYLSKEYGNGEVIKYKLPKNLNILNAGDYKNWNLLMGEFPGGGDYEEYTGEPTKDLIEFLKSKGYDGLIHYDDVLVFDKNKVEEIK
jgi:hypothetical protein